MSMVKSLKKHVVVFTGSLPEMTQGEAQTEVARRGGNTNDHVTSQTTMLVRGQSPLWLFREYGTKEEKVAEYVRNGFDIVVVDVNDFLKFLRLGTPISPSKSVAGFPISELLAQHDEASCKNNSTIPGGNLDRWTETKTRAEQAKLRAIHLNGKTEAACSICGNTLPASVLRTSHLKLRSECSAKERRDSSNIVMLMCELGCDALYEKGFFTINDKGKIVATKNGVTTGDLRKTLKRLDGKLCKGYHDGREPYLQWHRTKVFLG